MCMLMFSTMPTIGTPTFSNILRPLRASISAMSCGVVTMTAPVTGPFCASGSWVSPVPGGLSPVLSSRARPFGSLSGFPRRLVAAARRGVPIAGS